MFLSKQVRLGAFLSSLTFMFVLVPGLATAQIRLIAEDFESNNVGSFPDGWSDLALLLDPEPSGLTTVVEAADPSSDETRSLEIESRQNTSQGIYRLIEPQAVYSLAVDVYVDADMSRCLDNFLLEIGFAFFNVETDPYWWRIVEANMAGEDSLFFLSYSGPEPFEGGSIGVPAGIARWYRIAMEVDTEEGRLSVSVTDLESSLEVGSRVLQFSGVRGRAYDTVFIASSQRGTCGEEPRGRVLIDNVVYTAPACFAVRREFPDTHNPTESCGDFDPGEEIQVDLAIPRVSCDTPDAVTIEDRPPQGWEVTEVSGAGSFDGEAIRWDLEPEEVVEGVRLSYTVLAPGLPDRIVHWDNGRVLNAGGEFAIEGRASLVLSTPFDECGGIVCWNLIGPLQLSIGPPWKSEELGRDYITDGLVHELEFVFEPDALIIPDFRGAAASLGVASDPLGRNPGGVLTVFPWNDGDGLINLDGDVFPGTDNAVVYAQCYVYSEGEEEVYLHISNDDAIQVLVNEQEVFVETTVSFGTPCTTGTTVGPIVVEEGENRLVVKSFDRQGNWNFSIAVHDEIGAPFTDGLIVEKKPRSGCRVSPVQIERTVDTGGKVRVAGHSVPAWSEPGTVFPVRLSIGPAREADDLCSTPEHFVIREVIPEGWVPVTATDGTISGREIVWTLDVDQLPTEIVYSVESGESLEDVSFVGLIEETSVPFLFRVGGDQSALYAPPPIPHVSSTTVVDTDFEDEVPGDCPEGWVCNGSSGFAEFMPHVSVAGGQGSRLRLTEEENNLTSSAFFDEPIDLRLHSLTVEFDVFMHKSLENEAANGFCLVFLDALRHGPTAIGEGGGGIGYQGLEGSFALEFDIWDNDREGTIDPSGVNSGAAYVHAAVLRDGYVENHLQTHLDLNPRLCPKSTDPDTCDGWPEFVDTEGSGVPLHVEVEYNSTRLRAWLSAPPTAGGVEPGLDRTLILDAIVKWEDSVGVEDTPRLAYVGFTAANGGRSVVQEVDNLVITRYSAEATIVLLRRGDGNGDADVNISDAVAVLNYLFLGGTTPGCLDAADSDDSGTVDLTDAIYVLNFLFLGGPPPEEPFPACGSDSTEDELTCEMYQTCE